MAQHNLLGSAGEQAARDFLIGKGLVIRETNWRLNHLEIDIVAYDTTRNVLHVVEVKTRRTAVHYDPMSAITKSKIRNLVNAATGYIHYYRLRCGVQYDVMTIVGEPGHFEVTYVPNAFKPPLRTYR